MKKQISQVFTDGLLGGYAGKGKISDIKRSIFSGKANHSEPLPNSMYHDEWFVPNHLGGGQELVKIEEIMFTRLYGGGTPSVEKLSELGITTHEVEVYLKRKIVQLGDRTRLYEDCRPKCDGDWQYLYEILLKDQSIPVISAVESIMFK